MTKTKGLTKEQKKIFMESVKTGKVKVIAMSFWKVYPHIDVDDLEAFLYEELLKNLKHYRSEKGDAHKFVNAVLRQRAINFVRRESRYIEATVRLSDFEVDEGGDSYVFASDYDVSDDAISNIIVKQIIDAADEDEKSILTLLMLGHTRTQAAKRLNLHTEQVRRKLKKLRKKLEKIGISKL